MTQKEYSSVPFRYQTYLGMGSQKSLDFVSEDLYVKRNAKTPERYFTMDEVQQHNSKTDCWVVVDGKVYDVTAWVPRHPGGELLILDVAGVDITDPFLVNHLPFVREKLLPKFQIGYVSDYKVCEKSKSFREFAKMVEQNSWYQTDYVFYAKLFAWVMDSKEEKPLEKTDFLTQQIDTCLDIDCFPMNDWFFGGLQFQTAHHVRHECLAKLARLFVAAPSFAPAPQPSKYYAIC
ncbi:uncharacterized protein LOC129617215 [Condylostylus longicornis]|uniref:uncharacterized protein LOC129617215 n=1 Tax=Condylostylus longicornis TaxID=2530218 RepID=UPI00244DA736|nr:uncharacterized protein LOC129617215 [Condylostylus longicornis]